MELTLSRPLEFQCFEVFAEIAKADRRQEIQAVLLLAQEMRGRLTPEIVCRDLLGGRPPIVGRTILRRCREYGLMEGSDEESFLTEEGKESVSTGLVFIPEKGKYRLWVTDDPLFTEAALDLVPVKEEPLSTDHVRASRLAQGKGREGAQATSSNAPIDMTARAEALRGRVFTPLTPGSQQLRINFVGPKWVNIEDVEAHLAARITWTTSDTRTGNVRLDGAFQAEGLTPPGVPFRRIWTALLGPLVQDWHSTENGAYLRCAFEGDGLVDANLRSFRRTLEFEAPSVPDLGEFDALEVEDVPIAPRGRQDAQAWAEWLLQDRISSYQDGKTFASLQREVLRSFPDFEVSLPNRLQLLGRMRRKVAAANFGRLPAAYWFLQAPLDLREGGSSATSDESGDVESKASGRSEGADRRLDCGYQSL